MPVETRPVALETIKAMRDIYRHNMNCQIIHDSIHARPGWTREYAFFDDDAPMGYGSIAVGGPWKDKPTVYEYYVLPAQRRFAALRPNLASLPRIPTPDGQVRKPAGVMCQQPERQNMRKTHPSQAQKKRYQSSFFFVYLWITEHLRLHHESSKSAKCFH